MALLAAVVSWRGGAQEQASLPPLARSRWRNGEETLRAFAPVSEAARRSIVKFSVDGKTVVLGTVVDASGLALTKASELQKGKLTCWLASDMQVDAEVIGIDEQEDVALVRVKASGLKPIEWAAERASVGQWAITPGIGPTPHAVGIISALPRRVRLQHAVMGVVFDASTSVPTVEVLQPGFGAQKAGLKAGDIIAAVNGKAVTNRSDVVEELTDYRVGQTVKLAVQRAEERFEVEVELMARLSSDENSDRRTRQMSGAVSQRAEGFDQVIEHDTVLTPWLCGGPLMNLDGKAIGMNIARASRVSTFALPAELTKRILENLRPAAE
jgi:serine protease Do